MAQRPKAKPKSKDPKSGTDKEQSERFIEVARAIGADATAKQFESLFDKVVPAKRPKKKQ